jgi:hypothetical protein
VDDSHFDALTRVLFADGSRRQALVAAVVGLGTILGLADAEAKKKKKKKETKKPDSPPPPPRSCPSGQKACGNDCIAATGCCASDECGANGTCANHACQCASGFVATCDGTCIPDEPGLVVCCEQNILCNLECCDVAAGQVCHVSPSATDTCQGGGCPAGGMCQTEDFFVCAGRNALDSIGLCECTTPIDGGQSVCVSLASLDCNNTCTSSAGCGAGAVCIANGPWCGCEEEVVGFCGTLCSEGCGANCSQRASSAAYSQTGSAWVDVLAPKLSGRKQSPPR